MKPIFIQIQGGSHLNLNAVTRLRRYNKTILAECPGQSVTLKRFESEKEAEAKLQVLLEELRIKTVNLEALATMFADDHDGDE